MERSQAQFRIHVAECLAKAEEKYAVSFGRVMVTFDLKGTAAAKAGRIRRGKQVSYSLRFNKEAIKLDWDMMVESTIAHEVAHLVAYADPSLRASEHNRAWKMIAISLGDREMGATCHTLPLKSTRKTIKFIYVIHGNEYAVNGTAHRKIQKGLGVYSCPRTRDRITPDHYQGYRND